jgi:excinuclease ABC subunit C
MRQSGHDPWRQAPGDRPFFPTNAGDSDALDAVLAFVRQHYAAHPAPARILSHPMPADDDRVESEASLAELSGRPVPIQEARTLAQKAWIEMALQNARLAILARNQASAQQEVRLAALQEALQLAEPILRIECFDISHTMGEATVASCVVYDGHRMKKSDYRRFNIRDIQPGDDYAAMRQAVSRRYDSWLRGGVAPDLILIDGGKGQVASAFAALADLGLTHLPMIGVAKGEERKPGLETLIFPDEREPLQLPSAHPALHLIQEVRDEAHRFAITGHRARAARPEKLPNWRACPESGRLAARPWWHGLAACLACLQRAPNNWLKCPASAGSWPKHLFRITLKHAFQSAHPADLATHRSDSVVDCGLLPACRLGYFLRARLGGYRAVLCRSAD